MERSTVLIWRAGLHLSIRKIVENSSSLWNRDIKTATCTRLNQQRQIIDGLLKLFMRITTVSIHRYTKHTHPLNVRGVSSLVEATYFQFIIIIVATGFSIRSFIIYSPAEIGIARYVCIQEKIHRTTIQFCERKNYSVQKH